MVKTYICTISAFCFGLLPLTVSATEVFDDMLVRTGASVYGADAGTVEIEDSISRTVVTGTRSETDIRHLPMTISVVDRPLLEQSHATSVLPVLNAHVPGFFSTSRGLLGYGVSEGAAGQMSVRGIGGPAQSGLQTTGVLVLIDGHPQYMGLMGHPIADACQTMMVERVEVLREPAAVRYGSNAMGGVINIVTRKMSEDGVSTGVNVAGGSYGTFLSEVTNRVRKGRFSSIVTASYNRTDGHRADMGFEQYGGYAKLGYDITDNWKIWADANVTHFNSSNPGAVDAPYLDNDQRITRGMASAAIENTYDRTSGSLSFFYNWGDHWINDGYHPGDQPLDYRFNSRDMMYGLSWYQSARLFRGNRLTLGLDWFHFGGRAWNEFITDGHTAELADQSLDELAGYLDFRQDIGSWLTFDAGVRVDWHSRTGTEVIPQAGLAFHLPENAELRAMASKGFRNPTIREMYMFPPQNPDLRPERLWSYEISVTQTLVKGKLHYGASIFYINGDNIIMRLPNPSGSGMLNQNSGRIENWGAEFSLSYRFNPVWRVNANYSWLHMENPVLASPQHKLYAGLEFTKGRWNASTGVQYVAGLYTDLEDLSREDFVLWDLQCSFRILDWLSIYVKGENLLAQEYEILAGYPMPRATFIGGVSVDI